MSQDGPAKAGIKFGNYEVLANAEGGPEILGSGAYGKTYKAIHAFLGTTVALKVIHDTFAFDAGIKKRFLGDARAMAQLKHPHIAHVLDCGEDDGTLYYAMEYCDGGDLEKLVTSRGALSDETALLLGKQAARALSYVHDQGFLHRDLKPSNLMLSMEAGTNDANLKVIDFGLVKALGQNNAIGMTQTGQFLGTLLFASPEQLREEELDERTDVFSLGLTIWFLLEGGLPLKGKPAQVVAQRLSGQSYEDALPRESHPAVRALLTQMLSPDVEQRPRNMHAVLVGILDCLAQLNGATGQVQLEGKNPKPPALQVPISNIPSRVTLVASNQRLSSQFEVGEEDKELQTDLGLRCRGKKLPQGDLVHLTIIRKALAANSLVVQQLDDLVSKASISEGRFLIRPLAFVQFVDQLVLAEEHVEGLSLLNVLRARRALSLPEASPILRQLSEACDLAKRCGLSNLELVAHRILFQFPRSSVAGMTSGGVERLITRPVNQWPPYLLRLAPAYTSAQRSGTSVVPGHPMSLHGGATMVASSDDGVDSPSRFARLIYRVLRGHPIPQAATMSRAAYVPAPSISEEGNRLLADVISNEIQISDCLSLLIQLWRVESLPEVALSLPDEADNMTNLRAATPTDVPNPTPPVQPLQNQHDVVILDPFSDQKQPPSPIKPPVSRVTDQPKRERPQTSRPTPQPEKRQPEQRPPTVRPPASSPPPDPVSEQIWIRPETASQTPRTKSGGPRPAQPEKPVEPARIPAAARSPHLPPPQVKKGSPALHLFAGMLGAVAIIALVWVGYQSFKPDPVETEIKAAAGDPDRIVARLTNLKVPEDTIEKAVKKAEKPNGPAEPDAVYKTLHNFYLETGKTGKISSLVNAYKSKGVQEAWRDALKDADARGQKDEMFEANLHIATEWNDPRSIDALRSTAKSASATPEQAGKVADLLKSTLSTASGAEKAALVTDIIELSSKSSANDPAANWNAYDLYATNGLADDPAAKSLIAKADISSFPVANSELLRLIEVSDPAKAFAIHRAIAAKEPGRADSIKYLFDNRPAAPPAQEAKDLITLLEPQIKAVPGQEQTRALVIASLMKAADPSLPVEKLVAFYKLHGLENEAGNLLVMKAKAGDPSALSQLASLPLKQLTLLDPKEVESLLSPLLDKTTDTAARTELARKVGKLKETVMAQDPQRSWKLFEFYQKNALTVEAAASFNEAKAAGTEAALLLSGEQSLMTGNAASAISDYLSCWDKHKAPKALTGLTAALGSEKAATLDAPTQEKLKGILNAQLPLASAEQKEPLVDALASLIKMGALEEQQRLTAMLKLYQDNGMTGKASLAAEEIWQSAFKKAQEDFPTKRAESLKAIHELAGSGYARPEGRKLAVDWLQQNVVAEFFTDGTDFKVKDPLNPAVALVVPDKEWKRGAKLTALTGSADKSEKRYFSLPQTLPLLTASREGSKKPSNKTSGTIKSPFSGEPVSVSRQNWYPGAELTDPSGEKFTLPGDIELLVATVSTKGVITSPFATDKPVVITDWKQWKPGSRMKDDGNREFLLPDDLPPVEKEITADAMTAEGFAIISPFTSKPITLTLEQWRGDARVEDPELKEAGVKALIKLPAAKDRPLLVAKLGSKPGEVFDPYAAPDKPPVSVRWSQWKPGGIVKEIKETTEPGGSGKKKKTTTSTETALFRLPDNLGPNSDPKLEGSDPSRVRHTIKSPYGGHAVEVDKGSWHPGAVVKDSEYSHLSITMPGNLGEWFELETGTEIDGSYSKVRSPYGSKATISVSKSNWDTGKAQDGELPFRMPHIADPHLLASVVSEFKFQAKNPYTGETETWGESNWRDGASKTWAGNLTYHLPSPVPKFVVKTATHVSGRTIRSPYGEGTKTVTWADLASGGTTTDASGKPMRIPTISDPKLEAVANQDGSKVTLINPYTDQPKTISSASKGDSVPSGIGGFTIRISQVIKEPPLKKRFVSPVSSITMTLDAASKIYYGNKNSVRDGGNPEDLVIRMNSTDVGRNVPPNYRFSYDAANRRMVAQPK